MQHDLNGNLERQDSFNAAGALVRRDVLAYPATNNRVAQETITPAPPADGTGGSNTTNAYDLSGFITKQGPVSYQYDDARQMKRYLRAGVNVRYVYDGTRRRVLKSDADGDTRFVYDQADHLIYEVNPDGSKRNYVWLGDIPLAVIDQNAAGVKTAIYFIETDFANTPRFLRRASGDLTKPVWAWALTPYGDSPANQNPDGDTTLVTFNLRYPGQYYDAESKLHYNHTRYFQPRTGRYLQPDLIGLEGGINVYSYVGGNPVNYTEPLGLMADEICKKAGYKGCEEANKRCRFASCSQQLTTMCIWQCEELQGQCKEEVDKKCENDDKKEEPEKPQEPPASDENGCYWDYERDWLGHQRLVKKCPGSSSLCLPKLLS